MLTHRSAMVGERQQVTGLFADVKGSLDLAEPEDRGVAAAERHLLRAQTMAEQMELGLWLPRVLVERARVAEVHGDQAARRALLERARRTFAATGARLRAADVARRLAG